MEIVANADLDMHHDLGVLFQVPWVDVEAEFALFTTSCCPGNHDPIRHKVCSPVDG